MKKIMFYINTLGNGGAERVMVNLATQFADNGYDTTLVTSFRIEKEYFLDKKVKRLSIENHQIEQSRLRKNISRILSLRKICKREKPEILISFMGEPNFRAIIASIGLPVKTIISVRNDPNIEYGGKLMRFVGKKILPCADGCVFQTEDAKCWFPKKLQNKSTIILNAVKSDFYRVQRKPQEHLIVSCGRLQQQKNHRILIEAFSEVIKKYPDAHLKIYGDGVLKEELQFMITKLGLENTVQLMGVTNNVPEALSTADIFVLSSDFEGMPNALMEAMAVGIPSIATDCPCGGPRMLINQGINGILVPVGDKQLLAKEIIQIIDDQELKDKFSVNAKEKSQEFTTEKVFTMWENYVNKLLVD